MLTNFIKIHQVSLIPPHSMSFFILQDSNTSGSKKYPEVLSNTVISSGAQSYQHATYVFP
ncbi:hypothetical protein CY34DRAFT_812021 [Suillus luteus UH-Slu-Lm8-n1]|uniref:Uncharacterized protein n=1 Tax=Suillus luteus UH-Slu-Lm8-n1 TaxID=930992 RepID=A0A0D0AC01_9AGAM|nr:hypothetical protein CY34DRAFT_812021 [Suillus luteus UH-Slu-Lm8-n1]